MASKSRVHRTREQWLAIIAEQVDSGLSQKRFCEAHSITPSAFYNAKSRYNGATGVAEAAQFISVCVDPPPVEPARPTWEVELSLGDGVTLRLRRVGDG